MVPMTEKRFRLGWVFISYCMIAGGLIVVTLLFQTAKLTGTAAGYAMCFLGAALGSFFAARASEGDTIIEPALGALLVVASFIAMVSLVAGLRSLVALKSEKIFVPLLGLSAAMSVGGITGAILGERTSTGPRSESGLRWAGISALINLGLFYMAFLFLAILLLRSKGAGMSSDDVAGAVLGALAAAAFFGCLAAQAVAPRRMIWSIGFGFMLAMLPFVLWSGSSNDGNAAVGIIIIGGGGILVGALGALVGWNTIGSKYHRMSSDQVAAAFE